MGIRQAITDSVRRLRSPDHLDLAIVATWRDLLDALPDEGLDPAFIDQLIALRRRVDQAGAKPDRALLADLVQSQHQMAVIFRDLNIRGKMITETSRASRRAVSATSLRVAQLEDEIGRVRKLIADECRRRHIRQPTYFDDSAVVEELYKLFEGISGRGSRRMQSAGQDPVLVELLGLLDNPDLDAIRRFPKWLQGPAKRLLDLIAERDRYRKLLERQGLLPT